MDGFFIPNRLFYGRLRWFSFFNQSAKSRERERAKKQKNQLLKKGTSLVAYLNHYNRLPTFVDVAYLPQQELLYFEISAPHTTMTPLCLWLSIVLVPKCFPIYNISPLVIKVQKSSYLCLFLPNFIFYFYFFSIDFLHQMWYRAKAQGCKKLVFWFTCFGCFCCISPSNSSFKVSSLQ